mgnify:CR=1 FL=1
MLHSKGVSDAEAKTLLTPSFAVLVQTRTAGWSLLETPVGPWWADEQKAREAAAAAMDQPLSLRVVVLAHRVLVDQVAAKAPTPPTA